MKFAFHLYEWLESLLQRTKPWMSERDIEAGQRWNSEVSMLLKETHFGVICLTPENVEAPWLLFEAGALAKAVESARVVPVLFGMGKADLTFPLAQFQSVEGNKDGLFSLSVAINRALGDDKLSAEVLSNLFESLWPNLEASLNSVPPVNNDIFDGDRRSDREILEDVLEGVRSLQYITGSDNRSLSVAPTTSIESHSWEDYYIQGVRLANTRSGNKTNLGALLAYNNAIAIAPSDLPPNTKARLHGYRGAILKRLERLEEAESGLLLAKGWAVENKEVEDILYNLACVMAMNARLSEALTVLKELISRNQRWKSIVQKKHYFARIADEPEFIALTS